MAKSVTSALEAAIEQLVRGACHDPFSVLGPHSATRDGRPVTLVRVFQPYATSVQVILPGRPPVPMERTHPAGMFESIQDATGARDYRLRVTYREGHTLDIDDPYRYGQILTDFDLHLFGEGTQYRAFEKLGAHLIRVGDASGVHFAVWAPNAERVSVIGDLNGWDGRVHPMRALVPSGIWEIFIPDLPEGERYKFEIVSRTTGEVLEKADPYALYFETPPRSASITYRLDAYTWRDAEWVARRMAGNAWLDRPLAIYEVHLGSWARGEGNRFLSYRELAERLIPYARDMGYTHIELLPVMEHPFAGSWGYQVIGFFAPTSRFGTPNEFKWFVDECHASGVGVILDWVPGHFPKDAHGLARFDGTALYEHADPRQGEHRDWGTLIFNYGRREVRNFLLSNGLFWLEEYHVDGLRVDAVASMLYLDYSREPGDWVPNRFGGRENLEAIEFLHQLNKLSHQEHPGTVTVAEESTAWPGVSRPVYSGGLGFTFKWNLGWMHDILLYMSNDPVYRKWDHKHLTFSMLYAFTENFILPFSHDEVVHQKGSLIGKMPGDAWQKAASLRALFGFMYGHPGKKLMFMGDEFGQWREWDHDSSLDWHLLDDPLHSGLQRFVRDLNRIYAREASLFEVDFDPEGFQWIDCNDHENSVISFVRRARDRSDFTVMVVNFTPVPRDGYLVGVPEPGYYRELLNSDGEIYGGSNVGNKGGLQTEPIPAHGHQQSLRMVLPPLGFLLFKKA